VNAMNRVSVILLLTGWVVACSGQTPAQSLSTQTAAAIAERQEAEERYRRLNSAVEELLTANLAQQKRLAALAEEVQSLRAELARSTRDRPAHASLEDLQKLAQKVKEIDEKREADKKLILDELQKLAKLASTPPAPPPENPKPAMNPASQADLKGYEYTVQPGDFLGAIIEAYRKQGVKVTLDQVVKANPKLRPNRLIPGQVIFIPDAALSEGRPGRD